MGKAFEKQTKTIEDQGEKQIKVVQDNKDQLLNVNVNNDNDYKNKLLLSREGEIFKNKRLDKIEELNKKIDYNNLKYTVISSGEEFELMNQKILCFFLTILEMKEYH